MISSVHSVYRSDVDGLRAIAVLFVIAYHASIRFAPGGFVGVDVFFVISGFLISSIVFRGFQEDRFSFIDFYSRRVRRIFPALAVVLLATWLLGWFLLQPQEYVLLGKHIAAGSIFASNILLWKESGYFDAIATSKPLLHLWSLGVEEQFYLFWPLCLFLFLRTRTKTLILIGSALGISFAINIWGITSYPAAIFYLPFSRFWELMIGATLAYFSLYHHLVLKSYQSRLAFRLRGMEVKFGELGGGIGLLLILLSAFGLSEKDFPGWLALGPTIGAALLILAGAESWVNQAVLSNRLLVAIGRISYPLYLWHWPLMVFARFITPPGHNSMRFIALVGAISLAFALSYVTYLYIEKPLRYGFVGMARYVVAGLSGSMGLLLLVGCMTVISGGWSVRYPEEVRKLLDYNDNYAEKFRNGRCLLSGNEQDFAAECTGVARDFPNQPLLLIWGDSHGAMLYEAINQVAQSKGTSVAQFTSSSCPPFLNFDKAKRPLCRHLNDVIFQQIQQLRPETVILAHDWPQSVGENSLAKLPETVSRLRGIGVGRVILVGPPPHWNPTLPTEFIRYVRNMTSSEFPERMTNTNESVQKLDATLAIMAKSLLIDYIPSYATFCNSDGCLVTVSSSINREFTAFDEAHLTTAGAKYLIAKNASVLFGR